MANYDLNSITHGNDTYNLKDNSKIPLSGTNALSGSIVPSTDNSVDLGASSKNIKMIYTKGITINGIQFVVDSTLDGTSSNAISNSAVSNALTSVLPVGSYIQFAGSQAPDGFLVCNGGAISRTTYSALFAVIGTTYGSGDGSTTFNLPNLTDRFLQGSTTSGTVKDAGLPNIEGHITNRTYSKGSIALEVNGCFVYDSRYSMQTILNTDGSTIPDPPYYRGAFFSASRSNSIYGSSSTVQPPALTCLICIKY